jgi:hypothetical protein
MIQLQFVGVILLLLIVVPIVLILIVGLLFGALVIGRALLFHVLLLAFWAPRGCRVLFVYSNSPNWQAYCEREILPRLPETAVVLNWSDRKKWPPRALATRLFHAYGGGERFNPLGIVFRPFKPIRVFRFWQPFRDAKHGKPQELERVKSEFLTAVRGQV